MYFKYFATLTLFFLMARPFKVYAQDETREIIIISDRVGEEINNEEREKFNLFPGVSGFQSARYYKNTENLYFLEITYVDEKSGELKTNHIQQSIESIQNRAYTIDNFDKIQSEMPVDNERIAERSDSANDELTRRKRVDYAERKFCFCYSQGSDRFTAAPGGIRCQRIWSES